MERLDNLSDNSGAEGAKAADYILQTMTQDLKHLHQDLVSQFSQDIARLQSEKTRLQQEVDALQSQHQTVLSQQQLAQQQIWAKHLVQALAQHLQAFLVQKLNQAAHTTSRSSTSSAAPPPLDNSRDQAQQMLSSLDATLSQTVQSLQQDLKSYQSSLTQQIGRMHTLEQQGEVILEALVNRLSQQLQTESAKHPIAAPNSNQPNPTAPISPSPQSYPAVGGASIPPEADPSRRGAVRILPVASAIAPEPSVAPTASVRRPLQLSQFQTGLLLILFSTIALSLHNVAVGIIGNPSRLFGLIEMGGYIRLNSLGNSLLILWMRMLVVVPLMTGVATLLYPSVWKDIKTFSLSKDQRLLRSVVGSGFFLFLSQVLIYIAIGQIGPGVAVTILFMYPIVTVPLAWILFGDRPTPIRIWVMVAICSGVVLAALPNLLSTSNISILGISAAATSGIAFAFYLISMQISFRKLHPVPVSLIQFGTIFILTSLCLIFLPLGVNVEPEGRAGLVMSGIVLGTLTLLGYLLNNFGVRLMGAARASIIASSGPALTALLAFLITPGIRTELQPVQILGILIVTAGVTALSFERISMQRKAASSARSPGT